MHSARAAVLVTAVTLLHTAAQAQAIEAWVQRYDQEISSPPVPVAVDVSGNVHVAGVSDGGDPLSGGSAEDWVTLKYSAAGLPLWTNYYNGPGNSLDLPWAQAVDASGNLFVTGGASGASGLPLCTTVKYSPDGTPLWTRSAQVYGLYGVMCLAVDNSGNVVVTCQPPWNGSNHDILTIKYSNEGAPLWSNRYNGPANGDDYAWAMATDAADNVVVAGQSSDLAMIVKCSSGGALLWTKTYGSLTISRSSLALDSGGNVLVTGSAYVPGRTRDFLTLKYSNAGVPLWTNRYDGPAAGSEYANAVAVDASDNVYVTGESDGIGTQLDYATIKYSSAGVPIWTNRYNGIANHLDIARALALDGTGNVFVTGSSYYSGGQNSAIATVAYSSSGLPLWTNLYNGPGNYLDHAWSVAVDASGAVYVAGNSQDSDGNDDLVTVKYVIPPILTRPPLSCTNAVGTTAAFTAEAVGGLPLSYQWRKGNQDLTDDGRFSGVTTTNLQIANVQLADAGGYSVVVTNAHGSASSQVAQLTVVVPPSGGQLTDFANSLTTGFSFIFRDGTVGQTYRIQRSSSMAEGSWEDWMSLNYTEPVVLMDMGVLTTTNRFYRAISP